MFAFDYGARMNCRMRGVAGLAIALIATAVCMAVLPPAAAADRRVDWSDWGREVRLYGPALSPDGRWVAVVVERPNYQENRFERSLMLLDTTTGAARSIATAHSSANEPSWSPRGDQLAWLDAAEDGTSQIYAAAALDNYARVQRLTEIASGVRSFAWQPNGASLAFLSPEPTTVREGEERLNRSFEVIDNDALATEAPRSFHLWLVPAGGGSAQRLTAGAESVAGFAWVPDSVAIVFASQPRAHNSPTDYADFTHLSATSTALKRIEITNRSERLLAPTPYIYSAPKLSNRGANIAYLRFRGADPWTHALNVAVLRERQGEAHDVTAALDRDVRDFAWLPGDDALLVTAPNGTRSALWVQPLEGPARELPIGAVTAIDALSVNRSGAIAFVGREALHPAELYLMTSIEGAPRRLTHFNAEIASRDLGSLETIRWRNDGFEETGVLVYPPGFRAGQIVPLVLNLHGGPEGTSLEAFDLFDQMLAAQGWAVLKPNYRGSNSQGDVFESAVSGDLGEGPARDILAGLAAVKSRGLVDGQRLAVSGWSYGGYMTTWLIGHSQGWQAAVAGAPLVNLLDWYDLSCCNAWADGVLDGSPWLHHNEQHYWQQSPVAYADQIRTPTLILAHLRDPEVPVSQSYSLYHALRDNGVPVQLIVYPLEGHAIGLDPVHERDTYRRWVGWIDAHFQALPHGAR